MVLSGHRQEVGPDRDLVKDGEAGIVVKVLETGGGVNPKIDPRVVLKVCLRDQSSSMSDNKISRQGAEAEERSRSSIDWVLLPDTCISLRPEVDFFLMSVVSIIRVAVIATIVLTGHIISTRIRLWLKKPRDVLISRCATDKWWKETWPASGPLA